MKGDNGGAAEGRDVTGQRRSRVGAKRQTALSPTQMGPGQPPADAVQVGAVALRQDSAFGDHAVRIERRLPGVDPVGDEWMGDTGRRAEWGQSKPEVPVGQIRRSPMSKPPTSRNRSARTMTFEEPAGMRFCR